MGKNSKKHKAIEQINLPQVTIPKEKTILPFNGEVVKEHGITFSFSCFDRTSKFFNLGGKEKDGTIGGKWFLRLLDCLKSVSNKTFEELKSSTHDLHPVDWNNTNVNRPTNSPQCKYWQFRLDKTHGRVIGILIDSVFYVVWLDPYHNFTNSEGYGGVQKFTEPKLN
ncbi:MAG: hypothetical protein II939_06645 [Bacteroidales bacterium]|nr:hypothetical protein [Bacteroidales bacterium]